jgi:hypothetical protein
MLLTFTPHPTPTQQLSTHSLHFDLVGVASKKMFVSVFLSGSLLLFLSSSSHVVYGLPSDQCTSIGVGYLAMVDNSAIATHNDDCNECDIRVTHVPAKDWKKDSMRPVFATRPPYPRSVIHDVSRSYDRTASKIFRNS